MPQLRIGHSFDIALLVRGRRKQLRLRQAEVARAAGVGREWPVDLEHGKPTAEVGKTLGQNWFCPKARRTLSHR